MRWILAMMALACLSLSGCTAIETPTPPADTSPLVRTETTQTEPQALFLPSVINVTPTVEPTIEPIIYEFNRASEQGCLPNGGTTYVTGMVYKSGQPANGYNVVFSYQPDGPIVAQTKSGPHPNYEGWRPGYYSHILSGNSAREGDWYFWITDEENQRISAIAHIHTDGDAGEGKCQQGRISFSD